MRIAHVKRKSVNVMENAMNAENIMPSLNVRYLLLVKKRNEEDRFQVIWWYSFTLRCAYAALCI